MTTLQELDLVLPVDGLSEDKARSKQEASTSPDIVNMRDVDSPTGRERLSTREGLTRVGGPVNGANAVRQIQVCQFDQRGSTFSQFAEDAQVEEWKVESPLRLEGRVIDIDVEQNRYVTDGRAGIAKYNRSGELVWKFVLPVESQEHIVRALVVDLDGTFYAAVSEGHPQNKGRIWKFTPEGNGASVPNREWAIEIDGYVERLRLREGVLYAACNFPDRGAAQIRAYRLIQTGVPLLGWVREQVPFPITGLDVRRKDGAIFTTHPLNAKRAYDLRAPDHQKIAVDFTPDRLTQWEERKWCILDPSNIDGVDPADLPFGADLNEDYATGEIIEQVTDLTGNGRDAFSFEQLGVVAPTGVTPPTLNKSKRFAGQDTLVFSFPADASPSYSDPHTALISRTNPSAAASAAGSQRTFIPTSTTIGFSVFAVVRTTNTSTTTPRAILAQNYDELGTGNTQAVVMNANTTGGGGLTGSAGDACFFNGTGGAGPYAAYDTTDGFSVMAFTVRKTGATPVDLNSVNGTDATNEGFTGQAHAGVIRSVLGRWAQTILGATAYGSSLPFDGELAYLLVIRDYVDPTATTQIISPAEFAQIEGYLHWRFGIVHKLDAGHLYKTKPPTVDPLPGGTDSAYLQLTDTEQMAVKWDPNNGRPRWIVKDDASATGTGGLGLDVGVPDTGSLDFVFTMGKKGTGTGGTAAQILTRESVVRRIKDNGDSASLTGSGTWESRWGASPGAEPSYDHPRMCTSGRAANDQQDGAAASYLFVPVHTSTGPPTDAVFTYLTSGTAAGGGTSTPPDRTIALSSGARAYSCAVEKSIPEYVPGQLNSLVDERLVVGTPREGSSNETIWDLRLVAESRVDQTPRGTYIVAQAGTTVSHVTAGGGIIAPIAPPTLAGLNYTSIVEAYQKLWILDGTHEFVLDPRLADGISRAWKSKTAGSLPPGCKLLTYWNERMVLARGKDQTDIFMTAKGDPENCDVAPPETNGAEAVAFDVGDPVNAMIPLSNDELLIGTPTRRLLVRGDPAQNGRVDRIGDVSGIAFGEAWCKDPAGNVYMFGSRGGVDVLGLGSISDTRIRRRLEDINLGTFYVRLVWNWRAQGLHVFLIPQGTPSGTRSTAYFWSKRRGRWFEDDIAGVITSCRLVDGDGVSQRAVWCGFADGTIRRFDEASDTDDGSPIFWRVVGGPLHASERRQVVVKRPRFTLAAEFPDPVRIALLASGSSELPSVPESEFDLLPPLTDAAPIGARGGNVWWRASGRGRVAFEGGSALVEEFGTRRAIA